MVIVTHDLDEAIKMGDRIAIMRDGRLLQYDTPAAILARPADEFVESFLGPDRAIKRLSLIEVAGAMAPAGGAGLRRTPSPPPPASTTPWPSSWPAIFPASTSRPLTVRGSDTCRWKPSLSAHQ